MIKKAMKGGQPFKVDVFANQPNGDPIDFTDYTILAQLNSGSPLGCEVQAWISPTPEITVLPGQITLLIDGAATIAYTFPVGFLQILATHPTEEWVESDKIQIALEQSSVQIPA